MAYDTALQFAHRQDEIIALHVDDGDKSVGLPPFDPAPLQRDADVVRQMYEADLGKLTSLGAVARATLKIVPKSKSIKEHIMELIENELIDVVVMGSVELSRNVQDQLVCVHCMSRASTRTPARQEFQHCMSE